VLGRGIPVHQSQRREHDQTQRPAARDQPPP
jgi:hypothetical protein